MLARIVADDGDVRPARLEVTQLHVDDPSGVVDFAEVFRTLERLDYRGKLSVEYFDLPDNGWALEDPVQWARDLAARVRGA